MINELLNELQYLINEYAKYDDKDVKKLIKYIYNYMNIYGDDINNPYQYYILEEIKKKYNLSKIYLIDDMEIYNNLFPIYLEYKLKNGERKLFLYL